MEDRLSILANMLILLGLILSAMIVSGCMAATESVGPQGSPGPQETIRSQGPAGLPDPVGQQRQFGVADPVVLVARILELAGLATKVG